MKILIIDDETKAREAIIQLLKINPAFENEIYEAGTVKKGIKMIDSLQPDVIFLDINLPDSDGFDLLEKVNYKNFKLIIITANPKYQKMAKKYNAVDFILKPVDPDEFISIYLKAMNSIYNNI